jgi:ATP-dependent DNA helicase RecG
VDQYRFLKDYQTGKEGFSLAGILLFGKDETILSVIPHHKTDLILRRDNLDRYDDRDDVRTNLIESYDRIIAFGQKHLSDPFYLEGTQRISVRDKIMREIASNILIHREYVKAFPAKIIIEKSRILAENGNRAISHGLIDPDNFTPCPKNPVIARIFKEMGLADELGSGVRNLFKYAAVFSGARPEMLEEDIFRVIVPLTEQVGEQAAMQNTMEVTAQVSAQVTAQVTAQVGTFCMEPKSSKEIMRHIGMKHWKTFQEKYLNPLLAADFLERTIPDKPQSRLQKYRLTDKGRQIMQGAPHA